MFYCLGVIVHSMQPLKLDVTKLVVSGATQSGCESEGTGLWGATRQICSLLSSHVRVWMSVGLVPQGLALLTTIIVPLAPEKACPGGVQHLLCTWNITLLLLKFASPLKVWTSIPTEGDLAILNPGRGTLLLTQISFLFLLAANLILPMCADLYLTRCLFCTYVSLNTPQWGFVAL